MTDDFQNEIPDIEIRKQRGPSLVWLIPLIAALIGAWLIYTTYREQGPEITVQFKSAEGLEAGKTFVRYVAVDVGKVERIALSPDLTHALVTLSLSREIGKHLHADAGFWVVRPRISRGELSGLTTLVSGTYVSLQPGKKGKAKIYYEGLDKPPPVSSRREGKVLTLVADGLGSLDIGSPVYYRQFRVGEVTGYRLSPQDKAEVSVFIEAPYDRFVSTDTRFWNTSGARLSLDADGVHVQLESLASLLIGGIAFETPKTLLKRKPVQNNAVFVLYPDFSSTQQKQYTHRRYYVLQFDESLRGLNVGAPVEFRGIRVGEVIDIKMEMDPLNLNVQIPVLMAIEPQRISDKIAPNKSDQLMTAMVQRGLRAQLKSGNLLTGQLLVSLELQPGAELAQITPGEPYPAFPTVPAPLEQLSRTANDFLARLKKLPLDKMVTDLSQTLTSVSQLASTLEKRSAPLTGEMEKSLRQLRETLVKLDGTLARNSPVQYQLREMLQELTAASRSLRSLTDLLQRQPEALLQGKENK